MVGIIDFNAGNITSLERALKYLNIPFIRSKNPSELKDCDRFMFPGDGDDAYAMAELKKSGFDLFVKEQVALGKPLLGICVGSQIIFEHSDEGNAQCLGLIKGEIKHFYTIEPKMKKDKIKVPHMGWNTLEFTRLAPINSGLESLVYAYFVHSYHVVCDDEFVLAKTFYGYEFVSGVCKDNIFGFQPHPEKSHENGIKIIKNFTEL